MGNGFSFSDNLAAAYLSPGTALLPSKGDQIPTVETLLNKSPEKPVDTTPAQKVALSATSIEKKYIKKKNMFPLNIEGQVPHIYIKIFESAIGAVAATDATSLSLKSGVDAATGIASDYGPEVAALYGAYKGASGTLDFASFLAGIGQGGAAVGALSLGTGVGGLVGMGAAVGAQAALSALLNTSLGTQAKNSLKNLTFKRNVTQLKESIFLLMPEGIAVQYSQDYDAISVTNATGKLGGLMQGISEYKASKTDNLNPYVLEAASTLLEGAVGGEGLGKLTFFGATGMAVNPQMEMIYTSPQLRTFQFDFRLVPRNSDESQAISDIIRTLKKNAAPSIPTGITSGRYFIPPNQFEIEFYDSKNNMYSGTNESMPYLFRTKKCVLKEISIDYTGSGSFATFSDGAPVETRLQLTFQETTILNRADIEAGF